VLYVEHCSSIYREDEPPLYKITIVPLKALHSLFINDVWILPSFPFLSYRASEREIWSNVFLNDFGG
jgi:hypothetical protein